MKDYGNSIKAEATEMSPPTFLKLPHTYTVGPAAERTFCWRDWMTHLSSDVFNPPQDDDDFFELLSRVQVILAA